MEVIEVDRPNRQARRRHGKSDTVDAVEAARAALSRPGATGVAKTADGNVEAIRVLLVAYRSGRDVRIKCLNQIRHLGFTAPDELRERFRGVPVDIARRDRPPRCAPTPPVTRSCTPPSWPCRPSAAGSLDIDADGARLDDELADARAQRPRRACSRLYGVGTHTAAMLLVAAGDNAERHQLRSRLRAPLRRRPDPGLLRQDRSATGSTAAATAKPTTPCGGSCSPA